MAATTPVTGQAPAPAETDPTLLAAQLQQKILAAQQAQADASLKMLQDQQGMLLGMLPASSAAPKAGSITVTGTSPFDSQLLAYKALDEVADTIADSVAKKLAASAGPVIIYDQSEINNLVNYQAVRQIVGMVQHEIAALNLTFSD
jgi:hypothetical protein